MPASALGERAERLALELAERGVDLLLVSGPVNLRYLTGYTGSNGLALIGAASEGGGVRRLVTDFRYATQVAEQVPEAFSVQIASVELLEALAGALGELGESRRLGFDDAHLTVEQHARLAEIVPGSWALEPCAGMVERLRAVKGPAEIARIRAAAALVDDIFGWIVERGLAGRTERALAIELEHEMRTRGAQAPSFPSIVACGAHGALPHAEPRDVEIPDGCLVTIDTGALLDGYCSDCTRTFAVGAISDEEIAVYETVLRAQAAALDAVRPGASGREVDAVAREIITEAGHGEHFGHGLGHGVGLEIHEAPRLSRTAGEDPLLAGHIVTVEPGIYVPGRFGVRIEDLVVVTDSGRELLSGFTKELLRVS